MRRAAFSLLVALLALPCVAQADTVRLTNGRVYEDVIAERTAAGVRVQLGFGEITIPAAQVTGIEKSASAVEEYLRRKAALQAKPNATAAEWLELARWSRAHDNASGARAAAIEAAELDPHLAGLEPFLRPLGLVYDESVGRWIPYEESMARRGLVRYGDEWITNEERRERVAADDRRREVAAQEANSRRMADAAAAMQQASLQMAAQQLAAQQAAATDQLYYDSWYGYAPYYPYVVAPGIVGGICGDGRGGRHRGGNCGTVATPFFDGNHANHGWERMQWRQPGSLLPPPGDPIAPSQRTPPPARHEVNGRLRAGQQR